MRSGRWLAYGVLASWLLGGCTSDTTSAGEAGATSTEIRYRGDVPQVTRTEDAKPGVFIPPFLNCQAPLAGAKTDDPSGKVCTHVAISGATEPGLSFADYASCDVVRTQRPFWTADPATPSSDSDPRLSDADFMADLAWAKEQISATGCSCCHDSKVVGGKAAQWDLSYARIWLDSLSDTGLALFTGLADSSVLGAYAPEDNHGFGRTVTGILSTDPERMKAFTLAELARRGISEGKARAVPPFGGPIYDNQVRKPMACDAGVGVGTDRRVTWTGGPARYVYVLGKDSANPGVPPNLDLPAGTVWRLDVLASATAVASGVAYGTTPNGSFQAFPEHAPAPALTLGTTYHLTVLLDVGVPLASCLFTYGEANGPPPPEVDAGSRAADAGGSGFGDPCKTDAECATGAATYCAVQPGVAEGYCTRTGCKDDPGVCPGGWSCLDLSLFQAGLPAVCTKP